MSIATTNLQLTIIRPNNDGISDAIAFQSVAGEKDILRIPRRYPFADIANYNALKTAGYFRHATLDVSTELGGSKLTNTEGKLGFELPNTEKLILLVRRTGVADTGTPKQSFTIKGSILYKQPDLLIEFAKDTTFVTGTEIYEVNLFDFGLYISGIAGESGISIEVVDEELEFALVARMG